jgi:hypothetical protein
MTLHYHVTDTDSGTVDVSTAIVATRRIAQSEYGRMILDLMERRVSVTRIDATSSTYTDPDTNTVHVIAISTCDTCPWSDAYPS